MIKSFSGLEIISPTNVFKNEVCSYLGKVEHNNYTIAGFNTLRTSLANVKIRYKKFNKPVQLENVQVRFFTLKIQLHDNATLKLIDTKEVMVSSRNNHIESAWNKITRTGVAFRYIENIIGDMIFSQEQLEEMVERTIMEEVKKVLQSEQGISQMKIIDSKDVEILEIEPSDHLNSKKCII